MQGNVSFLQEEWHIVSHFILKETPVDVNVKVFGSCILFWFFFPVFFNKVSRIWTEVFLIVMQQTLFFFSSIFKDLINEIYIMKKYFFYYEEEGYSQKF